MTVEDIIGDKNSKVILFDKAFQGYLKEINSSLYMHMSSIKDVERETAAKKEDELVLAVQKA